MIYKYRTKGTPVIPEEIPFNTFKENPITQQLEKGSSEQLHHLRTAQINEQPIIRTQTRNVRITIEKKTVTRVRHKGLRNEPVPHYSEVKKIKKLNRGTVNIGPAKGMLTPQKLNAFRELKLRTPGKNYSMKHRRPELNIRRHPRINKFANNKHRSFIRELKRRYGLRAREYLGTFTSRRPSSVSVPRATRDPGRVQCKGSGTNGVGLSPLGNLSREGPDNIDTTNRGMDRDTKVDKIAPSKPIGGIVPGGSRKRKYRRTVFRISSE